ncbi:MAG: prepilin-type N-terminal cleavage/methylation domain-containing protein [Phycisphaeraceae bacterium]|nr:prepilin-type N-terminal cleavage/methylation domain-containing protein [Phycisphaeraceae bacterium]
MQNGRHIPTTRGGFTLMELLVTLLVVALLIGLLLVGFNRVQKSARSTAARQDVVSIRIAVEQFRSDFGFLPPLVKDGNTIDYPGFPDSLNPLVPDPNESGKFNPRVYNRADQTDLRYLRGDGIDSSSSTASNGDYRFSEYSLAYYLLGALGAEVDGVAGPGFAVPRVDGSFDRRSSKRTDPLYDPGRAGAVIARDGPAGRVTLVDRFGTPYRFYRWEQGQITGQNAGKVMELRDLNVPKILGLPEHDAPNNDEPALSNTDLRTAAYAIVSAGPNRVFGDIPTETGDAIEQTLGRTFRNDLDRERAGREDNIAEVSR